MFGKGVLLHDVSLYNIQARKKKSFLLYSNTICYTMKLGSLKGGGVFPQRGFNVHYGEC